MSEEEMQGMYGTILRVQTGGTNLWRNLVGLYLSRYWARES